MKKLKRHLVAVQYSNLQQTANSLYFIGYCLMQYYEDDSIEMAGTVAKASKTGLFQNERFLVLKEGFLYYYSQVPKNYKEGSLVRSSFLQTMPKHSICVANIQMIKGDFKSPAEFIVQFQHKHLMAQKDIRDSIANSNYNFQPKNQNDKQIVIWKFKVGGKEIRDKWMSQIKLARQKEIKQKVMIQTMFNKQSSGKSDDPRKSFIPWKDGYQNQKKQLIDSKKTNNSKQEQQEKKRQEDRLKQQRRMLDQKAKADLIEKLKQDARISLQKQMKEQRQRLEREEQEKKQLQERQRIEKQQLQERQRLQIQKQRLRYIQEQKQEQRLRKEEQQRAIQEQEQRLKEENERQKLVQYFQHSPSPPPKFDADMPCIPEQQPQSPLVDPFSLKEQSPEMPDRFSSPLKINIQPINDDLKQDCSEFQEYYRLVAQINTGSFQERLQIQKQLYYCISRFRDVATHIFKQLLDSQSLDISKNKYQSSGILFKIATCELKQTSNKMSVQNFIYDESKIKILKKQFKSYQQIVGKLIKYSRQNKIGLVIPLIALVQYKGVVTLALYNCSYNEVDLSRIEMDNLGEGLKTIDINSDKLTIKQHKQYKYYVVYIKQPLAFTKSQTLSFDFPLDSEFLEKARQRNCSISLPHLQKYRQLLATTKLTPQTKDVIEALSYCILFKYLRKIYRSSQGEVNQVSFWNLFFKKENQFMKLVSEIGCQFIPQYKGVMLSYIKYYFGVDILFEDSDNLFEGEFPVRSVTINPLTRYIHMHGTELDQTIGLFEKYVSEQKFQLAKQVIYHQQSILTSTFDKDKLQHVLYKKALILNMESSYLPSTKIIQTMIPQLPSYSTFKLKLYFLLIKNYSQLEQQKILSLFKETIDLISLAYGHNHYELITLNCIMAHYFAHKKKDSQNGGKFYQLALMLTQNYYQNGGIQIIEVYVDIGRMYVGVGNLEQAEKYLQLVVKMMKSIGNVDQAKKAKTLISISTILFELGRTDEALSKLKQAQPLCIPAQLIQVYTSEYYIYVKLKDQSCIFSTLHKMFLGSKNLKVVRSTLTLTLSYILSGFSKKNKQYLIIITEKMFVDGDNNHIELIHEKMGMICFGDYIFRIINGLCFTNPEQEGYEQYLNKYSDVVGILGKHFIVSFIESEMV